jgi:hypothetical protein
MLQLCYLCGSPVWLSQKISARFWEPAPREGGTSPLNASCENTRKGYPPGSATRLVWEFPWPNRKGSGSEMSLGPFSLWFPLSKPILPWSKFQGWTGEILKCLVNTCAHDFDDDNCSFSSCCQWGYFAKILIWMITVFSPYVCCAA